jgi:hypothetical protein
MDEILASFEQRLPVGSFESLGAEKWRHEVEQLARTLLPAR